MKILVTGAAGFIGFHVARELLKDGYEVIGVDNFNNYYDVSLKKARNNYLTNFAKDNNFKYKVFNLDIVDENSLSIIFKYHAITHVIHLAAQAGVRYSIENPSKYIQSNIVGFGNILENCKVHKINHLVYC